MVVTIRLWSVAYIAFCTAGVGRSRIGLYQDHSCISFQVTIRIRSVTYSVPWWKNSWVTFSWGSCSTTRFVSCEIRLYCCFAWVGYYCIILVLMKSWFLCSISHSPAYKSSSLMITFGSGFHFRCVNCTSGMGCGRVTRRSSMQRKHLRFVCHNFSF